MSGQALVKSYVCFKKENGFEKKDLFFPEGLRVELQFKSVRYDHYELENCTKEREKMASNRMNTAHTQEKNILSWLK